MSQKQHQRFYEFGSLFICFWSMKTQNTQSGERKWQCEPTHTERRKQIQDFSRPSWRKDSLKPQWFTLEKFYFSSLSSPSRLFLWLCCVAPGTSRVTIRQLFLQEQASMKQCRKSDKARKYDKYSALQCGILPFPSVYSWEEIYPSRYLFQTGTWQWCFSSFWESKAQISPLPALWGANTPNINYVFNL